MLYAAAVAGMVIAQVGTIVLHALGYYLTLRYGVPHGRANGALLGHCLKLVEGSCQDKVANIYSIFDAPDDGYNTFLTFVESLGISTRLRTYGVKEDDLDAFRDYVMARRNTPQTPREVGPEDVQRLLSEALD